MSRFDIGEFKGLFDQSDPSADIVEMARTAEAAERYEDMCKFMKELVNYYCAKKKMLNVEERNLLSVAYKNVIGTRRASWRNLSQEHAVANAPLVKLYLDKVEEELEETCNEVISLLDDLIPDAKDHVKDEKIGGAEPVVFYLKMAGDYYRYLAESCPGEAPKQNAKKYYTEAHEIAEEELAATHPIRLGLALNFSVCHYEILKDKKSACDLAKKAFDEAISKLDKLEESDYKDSTLIMQLLRDNLTLWTADQENDDGDNVEVEDLSDDECH